MKTAIVNSGTWRLRTALRMSTMVSIRTSSSSSSSSSSSTVTTEGLKKHVDFLTSELATHKQIVKDLLKMIDHAKYGEELKKMNLNLEGGGGFFVPRNSTELMRALQTPGARITLEKDATYLLSEPIYLKKTNISINGNGASIIGRFIVHDNSTFSASDTFFYHFGGRVLKKVSDSATNSLRDKDSQPLFDVTKESQIFLRKCVLCGARDGVYLGIKSYASIRSCKVLNCVRGVYEGVGCSVDVEGSLFASNIFHAVLLGPKKGSEYTQWLAGNSQFLPKVPEEECLCPRGYICEPPFAIRENRADVALDHDPISDTYEAFLKEGKPIELPETHRTTGLSDPVY